jgi:hypothetical protein
MIAAKTEKIILAYSFILRSNVAAELELREKKTAAIQFASFDVLGVFGFEQTEQSGETGADEGSYSGLSHQAFAAHVGIFGGEHAGADLVLTG